MKKWFSDFLCKIGVHKLRYISDHEWCIFSIAGCDHYRCLHCGKEYHFGFPEHPHEHKEPKEGEKYGIR